MYALTLQAFEWIVREGNPADEVCAFVDHEHADYLVMGDVGWSPLGKFV